MQLNVWIQQMNSSMPESLLIGQEGVLRCPHSSGAPQQNKCLYDWALCREVIGKVRSRLVSYGPEKLEENVCGNLLKCWPVLWCAMTALTLVKSKLPPLKPFSEVCLRGLEGLS